MARYAKPTAYLEKFCNGWFMMERTYIWKATDNWGNTVATGRTRKECERDCRAAGYSPVRD